MAEIRTEVAKNERKMPILRRFFIKLRVLIAWKQLETWTVIRPHLGATSIKISEQLYMQKVSYYTQNERFLREKGTLRFEVYLKNYECSGKTDLIFGK